MHKIDTLEGHCYSILADHAYKVYTADADGAKGKLLATAAQGGSTVITAHSRITVVEFDEATDEIPSAQRVFKLAPALLGSAGASTASTKWGLHYSDFVGDASTIDTSGYQSAAYACEIINAASCPSLQTLFLVNHSTYPQPLRLASLTADEP